MNNMWKLILFYFIFFNLYCVIGQNKTPSKIIYSLIENREVIINFEELGYTISKGYSGEVDISSGKEKGYILVKIPGGEGFVTIDTPHIKVEPGVEYTAKVSLYTDTENIQGEVYLIIREFESTSTKPFQPYIITPVKERKIGEIKRWFLRKISFKTKENTHYVNLTVVIKGESSFNLKVGNIVIDKIEKEEPEKILKEMKEIAEKREQLLPRTFVFSRTQFKYGLDRNYMRHWIDRPLLIDRSLRDPSNPINPYNSFLIDMNLVTKIYDLDGFAFFPETKHRDLIYEYAEKANLENFLLLPEFLPNKDIEKKIEIIQKAKKCKSSFKVNDKLLITSYNASNLSPLEWENILREIKSKTETDFLFLPAIAGGIEFLFDLYSKKPISKEKIKGTQEWLKGYVEKCDGLYFHYTPAIRTPEKTSYEEFYKDFLIPLYKSILADKKYKNKYLGLSTHLCHYNPAYSLTLEEDNTKTLRKYFEAAMNAKPDIIILPEWDEQNENTFFRPTVYNSFSTARILRYYMGQIKKKEPTPIPGDNTEIPNLIISYRKTIVLGEKLKIELLNVPDTKENLDYKVELILKDEQGNIVEKFEPVEFKTHILSDHTFILPSEKYYTCRTIIPGLRIYGYKGKNFVFDEGFHHINLRATWSWDFKYVKQPLRDLIYPAKSSFSLLNYSQRTIQVNATFECNEPIAFAEVLEDDDVVYSYTPSDEFYRANPDFISLWIEYRSVWGSPVKKTIEGKISIVNSGDIRWFVPFPPIGFGGEYFGEDKTSGESLHISNPVNSYVRGVLCILPKKDIEKAIINFDFNHFKTQIPVRKIIEKDIYSEVFEDIVLTVSHYYKQLDIPEHLNSNSFNFNIWIKPETPTSVFHLRVITKSGKTFRSIPLILPVSSQKIKLRIYSDTEKKPVDIEVEKVRVPEVIYEFSDERGSILYTNAGRPFWAQLGGFVDTSTGKGGMGHSAESLYSYSNCRFYPENVKNVAPQWEEINGQKILKFDGYGNFIVFPRETLPKHGSFKMSFEVMPFSSKNQYLFVCGRYKYFAISIKEGKLTLEYRATTSEGPKSFIWDTGLEVPAKKWSKIEVINDFEKIIVGVNEKKYAQNFPGILEDFGSCGFGGYGKTQKDEKYGGNEWWFEGYLKSFKIIHNSNF